MSKIDPGRRIVLSGILIFLSLPFSMSRIPGRAERKSVPKDLNLLVITVDTLRADRVGGRKGQGTAKTPCIDALASKGVSFSQAVTPVPLTLPAHCSLFTGVLPFTHAVRDNGFRLPAGRDTLAQVAAAEGLATAAFVGAFPLDSRFGLDRGFEVYDDNYGSRNQARDLAFLERRAEEVNEKAVDWISANADNRFFVWVHYFDPHAPYEPPPPFDREYAGHEYDGEVAYSDGAVGNLLAALDRAGITGETLVVLTSDHGEGLGEHQESTHGIFVYDSTLRVPLILSCPGILPAGRVVTSQVGLLDVMPTILEIMGWSSPADIQGRSLVPLIEKPETAQERAHYIESLSPLISRNWAPLRGIRTERWKYIDAPQAELFNLGEDPGEKSNVVDQEPGVVSKLGLELERLLKREPPPSSGLPGQPTDQESRRKLASLGYLSGGALPETGDRPDPKAMIGLDNLFNAALIASESGQTERAQDLYDRVLGEQPDFTVAYEYAAYNRYKRGEVLEAIQLLEKALERGLITATILARLGLYDQEVGRLEESLEALEKAVSLDPDYAEAHNYLGVSLFKSGRIDESIRSFERALSLDKDYAMAMNNMGNCYLAKDRLAAAEEEYRKAVAADGNLPSARNGLAVILFRTGRIGEAIEEWEASLEIEPAQPDALYNLGRVRLKLGDKKEALRLFELFLSSAQPWKYEKDLIEVKGVVERLKKEIRFPEERKGKRG